MFCIASLRVCVRYVRHVKTAGWSDRGGPSSCSEMITEEARADGGGVFRGMQDLTRLYCREELDPQGPRSRARVCVKMSVSF